MSQLYNHENLVWMQTTGSQDIVQTRKKDAETNADQGDLHQNQYVSLPLGGGT